MIPATILPSPLEEPVRPRCGCTRAAVDDQGATCTLCTLDVANDEALRAAPVPTEARPTVPFARCTHCGSAADPTHRCVDPVEAAFAMWLAAEAAEEQLPPALRVRLRRRQIDHVNARTAARLAAGPP